MEGEVDLEQVHSSINGVDKSEVSGQGVDGADTAVANSETAVGQFVVNIRGGEHRPFHSAEVAFVETTLNASLAVGQLASYGGAHSKSFPWRGERIDLTLRIPRKTAKDFEFF